MSQNFALPQSLGTCYKFTEIVRKDGARGLRIEGEGRNTVFVGAMPTCMLVQYRDESGEWCTKPHGFFDYASLAGEVAYGLTLGSESREGGFWWPGSRGWARSRTGWTIGESLHAFYKRCLDDADPGALDLQRAVFAATFSSPRVLFRKELYQDRYLVKDVIRHRAAAVALANLEWFRQMDAVEAHHQAQREILNSDEVSSLKASARRLGVRLSLSVLEEHPQGPAPCSAEEALGMMENWRGLFSLTGEPYRSLDRTLMNLPGGVPAGLIAHLRLAYLERPVLSRSELAVLTLHHKFCHDHMRPRRNEAVFTWATEDRIARATRLVAEHTRNPLSTRRVKDLEFVVGFLMDYPEEHMGNIVGLAERSIRWHRRQAEEETEEMVRRLGGDRPTEAPPVPLPEDPNIRFLGNVREVCEEGARMGNCVASYAGRAARGLCYLFHVSHAGEEATIEVDRAGRVAEASGPGNARNAASRWGRRALGRWGRGFPEGHEATAPVVLEEDVYGDEHELEFEDDAI